MPWKPKKPCKSIGCPKLTHGRYCEDHAELEHISKEGARGRGSSTKRGYGYAWQKLRKYVLLHQPVCKGFDGEHCGRAAQEVDHILPLSEGGTNDLDNLQGLCKSCHSKKTARDDGSFGRAKKQRNID